MCTVPAAIMAASSVVSFVGQSQQTKAYNDAAAANANNASVAASQKYNDEQRKFVYDSKVNQKEGYEAAMKGRSAYASVVAQSGASGFDAGSISIGSILAAERQKTAENLSRVDLKQDDLTNSFTSRTRSIEAEAQGRINSMPYKAGPNPIGLALNIASAAATGYGANPNFESDKAFKGIPGIS